jgi:hypothetical protein
VNPCPQHAKLRKDFELTLKQYRAGIEKTNAATLSVDPVEFKVAQEKTKEIEQAYKAAFEAYWKHCEQHQCETTGLIFNVR